MAEWMKCSKCGGELTQFALPEADGWFHASLPRLIIVDSVVAWDCPTHGRQYTAAAETTQDGFLRNAALALLWLDVPLTGGDVEFIAWAVLDAADADANKAWPYWLFQATLARRRRIEEPVRDYVLFARRTTPFGQRPVEWELWAQPVPCGKEPPEASRA